MFFKIDKSYLCKKEKSLTNVDLQEINPVLEAGGVEYAAYYTLSHKNAIECQWAIKIMVLFEYNVM